MKLKNKEARSIWYKKIFFYLKSGQSLADSVRTAATDTDTMYIYGELQDGMRFSDVCTLPDMKGAFSKTEILLLKVAEQTGSMQSVCGDLSGMLKDQHAQSQKLVAALIYPVLVLIMAAGLLLMILTIIVPKIGPLFSSMKSMPVMTRMLIATSDHVTGYWYVDIGILVSASLAVVFLRRNRRFAAMAEVGLQFACTRVPYIRDVYTYWHIKRWIQVVSVSLQRGIPFVQSLEFAHESVTHPRLQREFSKVTDSVRSGGTCSDGLGELDPVLRKKLADWASVIASGERTGTLHEVFAVSHEHISENLNEAFERFQKVIEPALIVMVGIMVLCICLSIILPMYQLTQSIQ